MLISAMGACIQCMMYKNYSMTNGYGLDLHLKLKVMLDKYFLRS